MTVNTCVLDPSAVMLALVGVRVDTVALAVPGIVVMVVLVPVKEAPSVPVTVVAVPATVCVVKTTVAVPLPLVLLVAVANDPFASDLVQVTVRPDVLTALPLTSASCAVMVTPVPATGL